MKLMMILPSVGRKPGTPYVKTWQMEPLAIAVLASLTPKEIECSFYDDRIEDIPFDASVNAVLLSVETYTARRAYLIAERFRQRGIPVIMGGFHATLVTDEVVQHADCVVKGNAETIWDQICRDLLENSLKPLYVNTDAGFNSVRPDRSIYTSKRYSPLVLIETGRGCPFGCDFCSISAFSHRIYHPRPINDVIDEIKLLNAKTVFFIDDNMAVDKYRTKELLIEISKLNIRWCGQVSLETSKHPDILDLMRKSGCMGVLIGFESLNDSNLLQMGKNVNRINADFKENIRTFRKFGIALYGTFLFGYDYDTLDSFEETYQFALEQKLFFAAFNHLVPFPGTPLYFSMEQNNRLLYPSWWLSENYTFGDVAFKPAKFTPEQLAALCLQYRNKFYSFNSILHRSIDYKANCRSFWMTALYFAQNIIARKDVSRRQGLHLGEKL